MDPHGVPPTDAAQLAANAMHVNGANPAVGPAWKSEQAFKNRSSKAIAALRQHIVFVPLEISRCRWRQLKISKFSIFS